MFLTAAEIASMKTTANLALPDTAVISRASLVSDSAGGFTATWATVDTVSCRVDPPGNIRLDEWSEKIMDRSVWILSTEAGTDLQDGDQVVTGGVTYLVVGILTRSWEIIRQAIVVVMP